MDLPRPTCARVVAGKPLSRMELKRVSSSPEAAQYYVVEHPLDAVIAQQREDDDWWPWGLRPVVVPCIVMLLIIAAGSVVTRAVRPTTFDGKVSFALVVNSTAYVLLGASLWLAGRRLAARHGGWGPTFGLRWPCLRDFGYAGLGVVLTFLLRIPVAQIANGLTHGHAIADSRNLQVTNTSTAVVAILVFFTVLCAPVIEETMFRGLFLRVVMNRTGFWPAAIISSVVFGLFHVYEVTTLDGAITLFASVAVLGLVNSNLVRITTRLTPGMLSHATINAIAVAVVVSQAGH